MYKSISNVLIIIILFIYQIRNHHQFGYQLSINRDFQHFKNSNQIYLNKFYKQL